MLHVVTVVNNAISSPKPIPIPKSLTLSYISLLLSNYTVTQTPSKKV